MISCASTMCMCVHVCVHGCTWATVCVWKSGDNIQALVLSFHHVGSRNWTEVVGLGGKHLYLSHVASPLNSFYTHSFFSFFSGMEPRAPSLCQVFLSSRLSFPLFHSHGFGLPPVITCFYSISPYTLFLRYKPHPDSVPFLWIHLLPCLPEPPSQRGLCHPSPKWSSSNRCSSMKRMNPGSCGQHSRPLIRPVSTCS